MRMHTLILVIALLVVGTTSKILFASEIMRHGARSSDVGIEDPKYFPNGRGMLTASGMRQHYLIGAQVRKNYMEKEKFLDPTNSEEIYVQSTQIPRTIQSAEAQLLGIYPLGSETKLKKNQIDDSIPKISIHNKEKILKQLGLSAVVDDYHPVPIHNYEAYTEDDVLQYADCPLMSYDYQSRVENETFWAEFDEQFKPLIYQQLSDTFGIPIDQIHFMVAYVLSDVLLAERFQGAPERHQFTEDEWNLLEYMQVVMLSNTLSTDSKMVIGARYVRPFLEKMKKAMGQSYNQTLIEPYGDSKMIIFSSHDLQLNAVMEMLNPVEFLYNHVEYASTLFFELHKKTGPVCSIFDFEGCYYVKTIYNGEALTLPGCKNKECKFEDFKKYLDSRMYSIKKIKDVCYKKVPTNFEFKYTSPKDIYERAMNYQ